MSFRRLVLAAVAAGTLLPAAAVAQGTGGVPPYEPPVPVPPPYRDGEVLPRTYSASGSGNAFAAQPATVASFADAYRRHGKPRLALYWNRQLSEALTEWYSDTRVVHTSQGSSYMSGDFNLRQSDHRENALEIQRRMHDQRRAEVSEGFEWEFQNAFLAPFLEAGAVIVDRGVMMRLAAADNPAASEKTIEVQGLRGKADYLLEILVASNWKSSTGYELRTRILDVKTGAIIAMVNSKNLREWNQEKGIVATDRGFVDLDEDDDDERFGPQGEEKYRATASGFEYRSKPPKLSKIAENLAYNTMTGLMRHWK